MQVQVRRGKSQDIITMTETEKKYLRSNINKFTTAIQIYWQKYLSKCIFPTRKHSSRIRTASRCQYQWGYPQPCDLPHDACDVTYLPVDRQMPVKTLPSPNYRCGR